MRFSLSHPLIKYAATGVAAILLIIITVTPLMTTIVEGWSRRDVELRSRLVFRSIEDRVTNAISVAGSSELTSYFEHLAEDEKLIALGFCDEFRQAHQRHQAPAQDPQMRGPAARCGRVLLDAAYRFRALSRECVPYHRRREKGTCRTFA